MLNATGVSKAAICFSDCNCFSSSFRYMSTYSDSKISLPQNTQPELSIPHSETGGGGGKHHSKENAHCYGTRSGRSITRITCVLNGTAEIGLLCNMQH